MDNRLHKHTQNFTLNNAKDFILCLKTDAHISKIKNQLANADVLG